MAGFYIECAGFQVGPWYETYEAAKAVRDELVREGTTDLEVVPSRDEAPQADFRSNPEPQELTMDWVRQMEAHK
jgi:hypothetical protein